MRFLKQIRFEIKNILQSKFLLIIGILVILASVATPVISLISTRNASNSYGNNYEIMPVKSYAVRDVAAINEKYYPGFSPAVGSLDSITINGITIPNSNPFYWYLNSLTQERKSLEQNPNQFAKPAVLDLILAIIDDEIQYYLRFAQNIASQQDYRIELAWRGTDSLHDKFFYEHTSYETSVLKEAASYRKGVDPSIFESKYVNITAAERQAGLEKANAQLAMLLSILENNDFPKYIALRIQLENDQIAQLLENIDIQNKAILANPSQEENLNNIIEDLQRQIKLIETNNIPVLEYRLAKNIIPGLNIWQNRALSDIENSRNQLAYLVIISEEEFNKNSGGGRTVDYISKGYESSSGTTYAEYVASMQKQIDQLNKTIIIAQKSLDANQPDMKYVPDGARYRTVQFLDYSMIVALFGVLIGGWLIASEFQQGTIRLLMIRPKTRTKILLSKFLAALLICLFIDFAGSLLNILTNGLCFGFSDLAYPNYTVAGQSGFFIYYAPKFLTCIISILFTYALAFMLSVVVKNIAVAIALPIVFYVGSFITLNVLAYRSSMAWLAYTPIPFVQISSFFVPYSIIQQVIQNGIEISLTFGIVLLLALSVISIGVSVLVFKKRDITN